MSEDDEGDRMTQALKDEALNDEALNEARAEPGQGREAGHDPGYDPGYAPGYAPLTWHKHAHLPGSGSGSGSGPESGHATRPELAPTVSPWRPSSRFALYYAPSRGSPWWEAGCRWLGRDPETGTVLAPPRLPELEARGKDVAGLSRAPARYGWHGTLVAPSRCAPGVTPDDVLHEALEWAQQQQAFELAVEVAALGRFVALRPASASGAASIAAVAADALHTLACLRAMATEQETRRRLESDLTVRQRELLERWGYPYVLDEFRFHMTLSDSLGESPKESRHESANESPHESPHESTHESTHEPPRDDDRAALLAWWHARVPKLGPLQVDSAALFVEPEPGAPFVLWARLPFGARG